MSSRAIRRPTSRIGSPPAACGKRSRMTSDTRSITCGRKSGWRAPRALEHPAGLRVDLPEPHGLVLVVRIDAAHQLGVADGGRDRVRVRVAMPGDVDAGERGDDRQTYSLRAARPTVAGPLGEGDAPQEGGPYGAPVPVLGATYARAPAPVQPSQRTEIRCGSPGWRTTGSRGSRRAPSISAVIVEAVLGCVLVAVIVVAVVRHRSHARARGRAGGRARPAGDRGRRAARAAGGAAGARSTSSRPTGHWSTARRIGSGSSTGSAR